VIIGRNESKNILRCISSIKTAIGDYQQLRGEITTEIIFVDSDSTDDTVAKVNAFGGVQIVKIKGSSNAAFGRNLGGRHAIGKWIFFLDGDMELNSSFLSRYWDHTSNWQEPFVFGQWIDVIEGVENLRPMSDIVPGGAFLILRSTWLKYQMDPKLKTGEEAEMGIRMKSDGHGFSRANYPMVKHYTVSYMHPTRIWKRIWDKSIFCSKAVTYRKHWYNKHMWSLAWKNDKTTVLLFISIIVAFTPIGLGWMTFIPYVVTVLIRGYKNKKYISANETAATYFVTDVLNIFYFFTYFPKTPGNKSESKVEKR
jgi:glycosyltransferase involved in cell wall biosynthesis